jgi:hypothetical protein
MQHQATRFMGRKSMGKLVFGTMRRGCGQFDSTWAFFSSSSGQNEATERFIQPETRKLPAVEARASTSTFIVIDEIVEHVESGLNWKLTNEIDN